MMNTSALYAEGGYFYNSESLLMEWEAADKPWNVTGWKYLEISSGPTFCQKGILHVIVAPCPSPVNDCSY